MAYVLAETPTFDPDIVVPEGTDSRVDAAEKVAALAQKLANRTRNLQGITNNAALKNAANVFTAANVFNAGLTANAAVVTGQLTVNGGIKATDGTLELTSTVNASGAVNVSGALTVTGVTNHTGQVRVNGGLAAADGEIEVVSELHANGSVYVNVPHLFLDEGVDIVHPTFDGAVQPQRLVQLDISRATIVSGAAAWDDLGGFWYTSGSAAKLEVPIILPRVTEQWSFQVLWSCDGVSGSATAEVWRWSHDYSLIGYQALSDGESLGLATLLTYSSTPGEGIVNAGPVITDAVDPANSRLAVIVRLPAGANNRLFGLRLQFWDPGPRNG